MTVVLEATVAERVAQALEFMDQAEAEFAVGDTRQGAEKLYGASVQAVIAASIQRGWDYNSHRANKNATRQLAKEYDDPFLVAGFTAAERFHIHFHHGGMEDYQITGDRYAVRSYVERMLKLVEEYEANRSECPGWTELHQASRAGAVDATGQRHEEWIETPTAKARHAPRSGRLVKPPT